MEPLMILEYESTPTVMLDKGKGKFEITGNSLPEDVATFYNPVFNWIREYVKQPNPITEFSIKLVYFNSSSTKAILDILTILEEIIAKGFQVFIHWHYIDIDEDMLSTGKEFESMLKIPFIFLPYEHDGVRLMHDDI
jgi:hypothetical protein